MSSTHTNLLYHIIYSTKFRRNLLPATDAERIYEYIGGIIREEKGSLVEIGGMADHIHFLARLSPTLAISDVLRVTKANSSKWINETLRLKYRFGWQRGFGAFTVSSSNVGRVRDYIQNQARHHKSVSFRDEYRKLLIRHNIAFDEKFLFEEEHFG